MYLITKNIGKLDKDIRLGFIIQQPRDRKSRPNNYMLDKLGYKKDNYMVGCQTSRKSSIPSLIFKDYWMLYEVNITLDGKKYKNTLCLSDSLIKAMTLKPTTKSEK